MPDYVLIVANSGRMLAQAARNSKLVPLVIDLFADQDTQDIAEHAVQLKDLSLLSLQNAAVKLLSDYQCTSIIYGSGLENYLDSLSWLETQGVVHGNSAAVNTQYSDSKGLFNNLDLLNIPYPKVSFSALHSNQPYLIKSSKMSGGQGVRFCTNNIQEGEYYQQYIKGEAGSVLFLGDSQSVQIIGFHKQWTLSATDFSFAGVIKQNILPEEQERKVSIWLNELVKLYEFKGLGSLDFIWDGEKCYFLEINCRPPASMMLYPELGLLNAHISEQFVSREIEPTVKGLQILYAIRDYCIESPKWPAWSFDRPKNATRIKSGQPICSIMADGKTVAQVEKTLWQRQNFIQNNVIR